MNITITITPPPGQLISALGSAIDKAITYALTYTVSKVEALVAEEVPVKFGNLRASVSSHVAGRSGVVNVGAPYALFVARGTRPHIIRARNAKALMWYGAAHPVRQVNHPGTKANPFDRRAVERAAIDRTFGNAMDEYIRRAQ